MITEIRDWLKHSFGAPLICGQSVRLLLRRQYFIKDQGIIILIFTYKEGECDSWILSTTSHNEKIKFGFTEKSNVYF